MSEKQLLIQAAKDVAKKDLYLFAYKILNYRKLKKSIHGFWAKLLQDKNIDRLLVLAPRQFFKSTLFSISFPIWSIFNDLNKRILIFSSSSMMGRGFMREIIDHFGRNSKLRLIWELEHGYDPYINPEEWTRAYVTFPRPKQFKEPSIYGAGVLQEPVSWHFDIIILDDVVTIEDQFYASIRRKKIEWFKSIFDFLEPKSKLIIVGTRWHKEDLYGYILNDPSYENWEKVIMTIYDENGQPIFPEEFPAERIEQLKKEKGIHFWGQYMQDPRHSDEYTYFNPNTFSYYARPPKLVEIVAYLDPALGKKGEQFSFPALIIIGKDSDGFIYVLDAFITKLRPAEIIKIAKMLYEKWHFSKLGVEANAFQSYFGDDLQKHFRKYGIYDCSIIKVIQTKSKQMRIESIEPLIHDGTIKFPEFWRNYKGLTELMNQFRDYPYGANDGIDALQGALDLLGKNIYTETIEPKIENKGFGGWRSRLRGG